MKLRELKETAHLQFVRGKFAQCAQTYQQVLRLAPRDPNMHVRHAEACRRAGDRQQAIASYRTAAELLLELGCETRARGALKAALELDPRDPFLREVVARLGTQHEEPSSPDVSESRDPSVPPAVPPVLLPAPVRSQTPLPRLAAAPLPPRSATAGTRAPAARPAVPPVLAPLPVTTAIKATASVAPASGSFGTSPGTRGAVVPPPPPAEALIEAACGMQLDQLDAMPTAQKPSSGFSPRLEVRRLSPSAIAFRSSPHDGWAVIRSHTPLELHVVEDLEKLPPMMQDLPAELTVASEAEAPSSTMH
jgi:hypothetical protein